MPLSGRGRSAEAAPRLRPAGGVPERAEPAAAKARGCRGFSAGQRRGQGSSDTVRYRDGGWFLALRCPWSPLGTRAIYRKHPTLFREALITTAWSSD